MLEGVGFHSNDTSGINDKTLCTDADRTVPCTMHPASIMLWVVTDQLSWVCKLVRVRSVRNWQQHASLFNSKILNMSKHLERPRESSASERQRNDSHEEGSSVWSISSMIIFQDLSFCIFVSDFKHTKSHSVKHLEEVVNLWWAGTDRLLSSPWTKSWRRK